MASLTDLYKECQAVVKNLSSQFGKVKFNKSLCRLLTNKYVASLTYLDKYIFRENGSIDLPCKTALVELRRIMSCGQLLVKQWTQKDWWMSVITSSDSASLDKKVILHLRDFLACVNVLVQMKTNMTYGPALDSLDSSVQQACRTDIEGLILSMKQYRRGIILNSKFAKLAKHLSEKLEAEISNHEHPYTIDFPLDVKISYKDCLGDGSFGTVYKCTFLGVMAAAKVWKTNSMNKGAAEKEARLSSKLRHPNVAQFIGYGVKENQPVIVSELMRTNLRRYLDEKKKNAGEGPPLPLLVAMNILLQIAEAINYLHENGVMHLDLKASNVLINVVEGPDGQLLLSSVQVKLTGFGQSELDLDDSQYTTPMVGSTRWRAPEVFEVEENREKYTKSADVYSFSMLCFEVLTGDVPFEDKPLVTILQSIRDGVRPQLPDVNYCPDYLSALIEKCWATNAVERPQFPVILQLLMDYKARVLKHPYRGEDVPPDSSQHSQAVDIAHTADTISVIEDDNNHHPRKSATSLLQQVQSLSVDQPYCKFSFKELEAATNSFSPGNWVGRVDWGELYWGKLQDGRPVAIMCMNQEEPAKAKRFLTEIEINTRLSHANIVSLIGYCVRKAHLILVYDFLPEGTLDDHLHENWVTKVDWAGIKNTIRGEGGGFPQVQAMEHWKSPILQHWKDLSMERFIDFFSEMDYAFKIKNPDRLALLGSVLRGDSTGGIIVTSKIEVPTQRIQFLFGNAKSMAEVVGVGLDFATVYLSPENVITVEKINQFEWEQLWREALQEGSSFYEPILISHCGMLCMEDTVMFHDDYGLKSADGSYIILLKVFALYFMARYLLQSDDVAILDCILRGSTCLGMPSGKDKIGDKRETHDGVHWPTIPILQFLWDFFVGRHGVGCKCYHGEGDKDTIQDGGSTTPGTNIGGQKVAQKHDHEDMPRAGMVADERWHKGKESISAEGARNYGHGGSPSEGGEGGGRNIGGEKDGHNPDHENVHKVGGEDGEGHAKVEEDPSSRIVEFPLWDIFSNLNLKGNEGQSGARESTSGGSGARESTSGGSGARESTSGGSGGGDTPGERGEGGGNPNGGDDNRSSSHDGSGSPSKKTPLETTVIVRVHPQYQDTNFHWEENGTGLQPNDQNLKDININPELELQFLKKGNCKKVMTKISVSFDIAAAKPNPNDENRFGWFQKCLSASLQCLNDNAARLAHDVSANVRETKITNKTNTQTTPGPWQRTGTVILKPPFLEVAFAGGKPTKMTSKLHEDSMETSSEHILGGFMAFDVSQRRQRHRLAYDFEYPNPPKDIKDTQCLNRSMYSGMCHTVYAVVNGTWDDLNDEKASEYQFQAHRKVCELTKGVDSKKRVLSVLKELMQIYEMKLYINHNMTNICNLEDITLKRRPDHSPLVSVDKRPDISSDGASSSAQQR